MYLLEVNRKRILLECGLYQGKRADSIERNRQFTFDPKTLDAAILSHAHIDHTGNLPNLCAQGYSGNVYCTFATRDLSAIMLADSAAVQAADAEFVSRQRAKKGLPPVTPLYSARDAAKAIELFVGVNYDRRMPVTDGVAVTFRDAGHILGSAQVVLDITEDGRQFRYLFSGDVGRGDQDILRDPQAVDGVDFLQIESTYGDRDHEHTPDAKAELCRLVRETVARGGKVIIPAFSVGRTQQLVYSLHQVTDSGCLPSVPMFVDSPLSVNATEVFRLHPECFDEATQNYLRSKGNPFGMENLTYIREVTQSKKLNDLNGPCVIISASGMAEAGRIRHHLANHIGDARNLILFAGYCAENTLGAQILSGRNPVNIFGEPHTVRAQIARLDAFSGHADRNELLEYVRKLSGPLRKIAVVHGEEVSSLAFGELLKKEKPNAEIIVPVRGDVVEFSAATADPQKGLETKG